MNIEGIAKIAHEANKAYCHEIGDNSQSHWNDAKNWQKQATIDGVNTRVENPHMSDGWQHEVWMTFMLTSGWVYNEVRDANKKTHPCLVSYEKLPEAEKVKDALFSSIVKSLIPFLKEAPNGKSQVNALTKKHC